MNSKDFLLEIGTEELPPKLLQQLSFDLKRCLIEQLIDADLAYVATQSFATPRRLAILVSGLQLRQSDKLIKRKGPAVDAPEQALNGFARSCGVEIDELRLQEFGSKKHYVFETTQSGVETVSLLAGIVKTAVNNIPIAKSMRWSNLNCSFVRPVSWLVVMLGSDIVPINLMGLVSGNITKGLRFTGRQSITINTAADYHKIMLTQVKIEVDFNKRKEIIRTQLQQVANNNEATVVIDESLLDEVCALVECPQAFVGAFDEDFLTTPEEALISAMKKHQKYFHMVDKSGKLLPMFVAIANIKSTDLTVVISGNERVIRPRLADAEFFWNKDKATSLESRLARLDKVLFMQSLGSMKDKALRIKKLSRSIANIVGFDADVAARAGLLAKADLISDMVNEFADLQGVMGHYYALNDGEDKYVAMAIREHYKPRFSKDSIPTTDAGLIVAIADKIDSITGIYGIGQGPTGSKDPYALKRISLGLLRIMIEAKLDIDIKELIAQSIDLHLSVVDISSAEDIYDFIMERLRVYYKEQNIDTKTFSAVLAVAPKSPYDFHLRIQALNLFISKSEAKNLIIANKRIVNILRSATDLDTKVNEKDLVEEVEKKLFTAADNISKKIIAIKDYEQIIIELLTLKDLVDEFFDNVMVNSDNLKLKNARLNLLNWIRSLFLSVADVSYL